MRRADGALTILLIDKAEGGGGPVTLALSHFQPAAKAQVWQLTGANVLTRLPDVAARASGLQLTVPAQSITLLVLPPAH